MKKDLVSVLVITYNSAPYIRETLESIYDQSYGEIELVISDDASTDKTVEICKDWISGKADRFSRVHIVSSPVNIGIPANCNVGVANCYGEWVKLIAGDDLLVADCVASNLDFIATNKSLEPRIIVSNMLSFLDSNPSIQETIDISRSPCFWSKSSSKKQFKQLVRGYFGAAPTYFINREVYRAIRYDEKYRFMEDYPFALNASKAGYVIHHMPLITVKYRVRTDSAYNTGDAKIYPDFFLKQRDFDLIERFPYLKPLDRWYENYLFNKRKAFNKLNINKIRYKNLYYNMEFINPLYVVRRILHKIGW